MPSDTAFLGDMPSARTAGAEYVSLGRTMEKTYPTPDFVGRPELSPRDIASTINNLRALGITIDENNRVLRGLRIGILTNYSLYALYSAYRAAVLARSARETAYAVAETAVMAAAQQWASIAAAVASSVAVYASFRAGWATAEYVHDYRADMSTPSGRRNAARQLTVASEAANPWRTGHGVTLYTRLLKSGNYEVRGSLVYFKFRQKTT